MTTIDLILQNQLAFVFVCTIFSLLVGSFLNVVIYRLPIMLEQGWRDEIEDYLQDSSTSQTDSQKPTAKAKEPFNLITPRSRCSQCKAPITALQNIPVISYLCLGGKCKHCASAISFRYPAIEALTAALCGFLAWHFYVTPAVALLAILLTWILITLTWIDYDTYLLPDNITLPLIWLGLIANYFNIFTSLETALWGAIAGYLTLWSVFWLFKLITGKDGMGYGDFKLLAALGAWLGWPLLPVIIILSSLVGAVIGIGMIVFSDHEKSKPIPFGPYLAIAGWIALVWGEQINTAYLRFIAF